MALTNRLELRSEVAWELSPGEQERGWRRRWEEVQRELAEIQRPHQEPASGEAIHAARHRLHAFYVQAYHLKDALRAEAGTTGIPAATVESAISNDPELALLADLANIDKHGKLSKPPRSGEVPKFKALSAKSLAEGGWRLALFIEHRGRTRDGIEVADAATEAWRQALAGWALL